ncbi:MAG: radical SAM protein [Victivallaceae bacterium]|nr:radical SAM protein [Victivallaceae bacterium]
MLPHPLTAPAKVYIDITARCNLRCRYCYHFDSPAEVPSDLPASEWVSFFKELERSGVLTVNISGGEPLIRPDISSILASLAGGRLRFELITNGSLLTPEIAGLIASLRRCNYVQISLDGPEAVHDSARGAGSFQGAISAIRLLTERGVPVVTRTTIGRHNLGRLMETAELVLDELGLPFFTTNCVTIENLCTKDPAALELSLPDIIASAAEHRAVLDRYPGKLQGGTSPFGLLKRWHAVFEARRANAPCGRYQGCLSGCGGVFTQLGVRADGIMVPCEQLSQIGMGRINRDSLLEVWRAASGIEKIRARRDIPLRNFDYCRDCGYVSWCVGGCPASGVLDDSDPARRACRPCLSDLEQLIGYDGMSALFARMRFEA